MKLKSFIRENIIRVKLFFWNLFLQIKYFLILKFNKKKIYYFYRKNSKIDGWRLSFSDEFSGYELDKNKWRTDAYYGMRFHPGLIEEYNQAPNEYYSDDCISVNGSYLSLKAINEPVETWYMGKKWKIEHQIGMIDSSSYFSQKRGFFEIKAIIPQSEGMWPAFWMASTESWPPEIDIFEIYTGNKRGKRRIASNVHRIEDNKHRMNPITTRLCLDLSKRAYTYGCEWNSEWIKFYFQNQLIRVEKTPESFIHPMHIIINNSVDPKHIDKINFPNEMKVFYVRAYSKKTS